MKKKYSFFFNWDPNIFFFEKVSFLVWIGMINNNEYSI